MARWGMIVDLDKCTGCGGCMTACKTENNVQIVSPEESLKGREMHWLKLLPVSEGDYPSARVTLQPNLCMMCDNPPCTRVCPVYATYKGSYGLVAQIYPRCIGCRYCMVACPFTVKFFNWTQTEDEVNLIRSATNPDVSVRPKGVVEKCTFCYHRLQKGKETARAEDRPLAEKDYRPACVETCPADALSFGDLDDANSAVARLSTNRRAKQMLEHLGTEPKVYFLDRREAHVF